MAIVTFWNDNTGKIGQTYSALAMALYMGVEHNYKILLISTESNDQVLLRAFKTQYREKTIKLITNNENAMDIGSEIEEMSKLVYANRLTPDIIQNYTKIVYKDRLEVISAPKNKDKSYYEKLYASCRDIISVASKFYDIVIVDLNRGIQNNTTKEILEMSNVIVLNIEQKNVEFEKIVELKKDNKLLNKGKTIELINNYDRKSKYSVKNISRLLGDKKGILSVPYCNLFSEAIQEGNVAEFFLNTRLKKLDDLEDRTTFFINELKRGTDRIIYKIQELQMRN